MTVAGTVIPPFAPTHERVYVVVCEGVTFFEPVDGATVPTLLSTEQEVAAEQFHPKLTLAPAAMDDGIAENVQFGAAGEATVGDATEKVAVLD